MTKEQKERSEKFLEFFEGLEEKNYDQDIYMSYSSYKDCSSIACISGWMDMYISQNYFNKLRNSDSFNEAHKSRFYLDVLLIDAREHLFGIKWVDQLKMFGPPPLTKDPPTKGVAVRMFRNFIDTGVVDWAKAEEEEVEQLALEGEKL